MKTAQLCLLFVPFIAACSRQKNCPPCTDCITNLTYQIVQNANDTLIIDYNKLIEAHYEGCHLYQNDKDTSTFFTTAGTYNLQVKVVIGGFVRIHGTSKLKTWTLRILSASGKVLATTENSPYRQIIYPRNDTLFENSLAIQYQ